MNKKRELLKELLLEREAGLFDAANSMIDLAIGIYCEDASIDRQELIELLRAAHYEAFSKCNYQDVNVWRLCIEIYEALIDKILKI